MAKTRTQPFESAVVEHDGMNFYSKKNNTKIFLLICFLSFFISCGLKKEIKISGKSMGTYYHITIVTSVFDKFDHLQNKIKQRLNQIESMMSTFKPDSEISKFNSNTNINKKTKISEEFVHIIKVAKKIYKNTNGAWDGTIRPLYKLWGFDKNNKKSSIPKDKQIKQLLLQIGFNKIKLLDDKYLVKLSPQVTLDLASIAKGYAVDEISKLLKSYMIKNFIVEIGGEVFASGNNKDGKPWKIGINLPKSTASYDKIFNAINLSNKALATSGNYRKFFILKGKLYSHIIDPKTGYPVSNGVVSASVISPSCAMADGLATALMVMGHKKGVNLINKLDRIECLLIVQDKDGNFKDYYSKDFKNLLVK